MTPCASRLYVESEVAMNVAMVSFETPACDRSTISSAGWDRNVAGWPGDASVPWSAGIVSVAGAIGGAAGVCIWALDAAAAIAMVASSFRFPLFVFIRQQPLPVP